MGPVPSVRLSVIPSVNVSQKRLLRKYHADSNQIWYDFRAMRPCRLALRLDPPPSQGAIGSGKRPSGRPLILTLDTKTFFTNCLHDSNQIWYEASRQ